MIKGIRIVVLCMVLSVAFAPWTYAIVANPPAEKNIDNTLVAALKAWTQDEVVNTIRLNNTGPNIVGAQLLGEAAQDRALFMTEQTLALAPSPTLGKFASGYTDIEALNSHADEARNVLLGAGFFDPMQGRIGNKPLGSGQIARNRLANLERFCDPRDYRGNMAVFCKKGCKDNRALCHATVDMHGALRGSADMSDPDIRKSREALIANLSSPLELIPKANMTPKERIDHQQRVAWASLAAGSFSAIGETASLEDARGCAHLEANLQMTQEAIETIYGPGCSKAKQEALVQAVITNPQMLVETFTLEETRHAKAVIEDNTAETRQKRLASKDRELAMWNAMVAMSNQRQREVLNTQISNSLKKPSTEAVQTAQSPLPKSHTN